MPKTQTKATDTTPEQAEKKPVDFDVRIYGAKDTGTQRATAGVNINGIFAIRGVKVLESSKGLFVAMPQYKVGEEYKDICFPCTKEAREQFNSAVMTAYEQALEQKLTQKQADTPTAQTQAMSGQSM